MRLSVSVFLAAAVLVAAVAADADHAGRRQGRRLRNGRRFGGRGRRPAPVNNFNGGNFPAVPSAVPQSVPAAPRRRPRPAGRRRPRPQPAFVPEPLPVPVVDPIPQAVPAVARGRQHLQLPRGAKSIDVEGTRFTNQSPDEFGNYNFQLDSPDGTFRQETGTQVATGTRSDETVNEIRGEVSWVSPEGQLISYTYIANENGYQPSNLPQAQPVPAAIQRSLDTIAELNARTGRK